MTEHPILSKGDMVKASLEGWKTQTRRVIKIPECARIKPAERYIIRSRNEGGVPICYDQSGCADWKFLRCPYGVPGDILWVRETWRTAKGFDKYPPRMTGPASPFQYKSDMASIRGSDITKYSPWGKWRASIHMPRWASRIDLEIIDIRVEQVQDITREDQKAEGLIIASEWSINGHKRTEFGLLWDSINEKRGYGWDKNPWVWVVEFKLKKVEASG